MSQSEETKALAQIANRQIEELMAERDALKAQIAEAVAGEREQIAKLLEKKGVGTCELGGTDYSTGAFECSRLYRGECNCPEFDEMADAIRARGEKETG